MRQPDLKQDEVVDEVSYSGKWHSGLINDDEDVALERIDPNDTSQKPGNRHSAASACGFGTYL